MYGSCGRTDNKADFDFDFDFYFSIQFLTGCNCVSSNNIFAFIVDKLLKNLYTAPGENNIRILKKIFKKRKTIVCMCILFSIYFIPASLCNNILYEI